jgi:hypothetical protein
MARIRTDYPGPCLWLRPVYKAQSRLDLASRWPLPSTDRRRLPGDAISVRNETADFHVCLTCGVMPIVTCMIEGTQYAVVNVNTFDDLDRSQLVETATDFEGETTENRLARRRRNWTPDAVGRENGD